MPNQVTNVYCCACGASILADSEYCSQCGAKQKIIKYTNAKLSLTPEKRTKKKRTARWLTALAIIIMIAGVIVAFNAELNTTIVHDGTETPTAVATHILVIMIFVCVSDLLLLISNKLTRIPKKVTASSITFSLIYGATGLFFSAASAYNARANTLSEWYHDMKDAPAWYAGDVLGEDWFESLPTIAARFSSTATTFFVLTGIGVLCTLLFAYLISTQKIDADFSHKHISDNVGATQGTFFANNKISILIGATACLAIIVTVVLLSMGIPTTEPNNTQTSESNNTQTKQLSSECDVVICSGTDLSNNYYELVGNQTETSQGFEITVGVIKNNSWLIPLSSNSEFLGSNGVFAVEDSYSSKRVDLYSASSYFNFIETGGFVMKSTVVESGLFGQTYHYSIFFSCATCEYFKLDTDEYNVCSAKNKTTGVVCTDNVQILVYKKTAGSYSTASAYDWYLLNTNSLKMNKIASDSNLRPESVLSDGLIFASDKCFYDTNMNKKIDLSDYNIDMWYASNIFFQNGKCTFNAKNQLGTEFEITIDTTGKVLSEIQK